jgi:hypothetical protein
MQPMMPVTPAPTGYLFEGAKPDKTLSEMSLLMTLRRMRWDAKANLWDAELMGPALAPLATPPRL